MIKIQEKIFFLQDFIYRELYDLNYNTDATGREYTKNPINSVILNGYNNNHYCIRYMNYDHPILIIFYGNDKNRLYKFKSYSRSGHPAYYIKDTDGSIGNYFLNKEEKMHNNGLGHAYLIKKKKLFLYNNIYLNIDEITESWISGEFICSTINLKNHSIEASLICKNDGARKFILDNKKYLDFTGNKFFLDKITELEYLNLYG